MRLRLRLMLRLRLRLCAGACRCTWTRLIARRARYWCLSESRSIMRVMRVTPRIAAFVVARGRKVAVEDTISCYATLCITFGAPMYVPHILPHLQSFLETLFTALLASDFDHFLLHQFAQPSPRFCSILLCIPPPVLHILHHALRTKNLLLCLFECVFV